MHYLNLQIAKKKARRQAQHIDDLRVMGEAWCVGSDYEKKLRRTRVPCSCVMCGNPRRMASGNPRRKASLKDRLTMADKRQNDEVAAQFDSMHESEAVHDSDAES